MNEITERPAAASTESGSRPETAAPDAPSRGGIVALLDREPPEGYRSQWTAHIAARRGEVQTDTRSLLIFRIGGEWLGLHTTALREVVTSCPLHVLPHRSGVLLGLTAVRGELMVCVDLAAMLGLMSSAEAAAREPGARLGQVIVAKWDNRHMTFPVDRVYGVHRYRSQECREIPATLADAVVAYTTGMLPWREATVACLDEPLLFGSLDKSLS